jgi:UDP-glucose 4-epimerase
MPVNERAILSPISFYGVGKIASEHYMKIYQEYGINSTSLRLFNVYGPGQNMHNLKQGMVSIFLAQALSSQKIHVKGDKTRFRDFVYIDDVVDAFLYANNSEFQGYKVYNVCSARKTTIEELIKNMLKYIPNKVQIKYEGSTPGDQFGIYGDNSLIEKELGWIPKYQLKEGMKIMIEWAKSIK